MVREQIKSFASTKNVFSNSGGFKLIILDEADAMTTAAQGALRRGESHANQVSSHLLTRLPHVSFSH